MYWSRDYLIYLFIVWNFIFFIINVLLPSNQLLNFSPSLLILWFLIEHPCLNNKIVQKFLQRGPIKNFLFNRGVRHQSEDAHLVFLPNSVRPVLRLLIHHRIPIRVENNNRIGGLTIRKKDSPEGWFRGRPRACWAKTRRIRSFPRWRGWSSSLFPRLLCGLRINERFLPSRRRYIICLYSRYSSRMFISWVN